MPWPHAHVPSQLSSICAGAKVSISHSHSQRQSHFSTELSVTIWEATAVKSPTRWEPDWTCRNGRLISACIRALNQFRFDYPLWTGVWDRVHGPVSRGTWPPSATSGPAGVGPTVRMVRDTQPVPRTAKSAPNWFSQKTSLTGQLLTSFLTRNEFRPRPPEGKFSTNMLLSNRTFVVLTFVHWRHTITKVEFLRIPIPLQPHHSLNPGDCLFWHFGPQWCGYLFWRLKLDPPRLQQALTARVLTYFNFECLVMGRSVDDDLLETYISLGIVSVLRFEF